MSTVPVRYRKYQVPKTKKVGTGTEYTGTENGKSGYRYRIYRFGNRCFTRKRYKFTF
ncbi:hypothetical protein Hdeb2414_s0003g00118541 [Helianthus debilis subsp. tardiflorus]